MAFFLDGHTPPTKQIYAIGPVLPGKQRGVKQKSWKRQGQPAFFEIEQLVSENQPNANRHIGKTKKPQKHHALLHIAAPYGQRATTYVQLTIYLHSTYAQLTLNFGHKLQLTLNLRSTNACVF